MEEKIELLIAEFDKNPLSNLSLEELTDNRKKLAQEKLEESKKDLLEESGENLSKEKMAEIDEIYNKKLKERYNEIDKEIIGYKAFFDTKNFQIINKEIRNVEEKINDKKLEIQKINIEVKEYYNNLSANKENDKNINEIYKELDNKNAELIQLNKSKTKCEDLLKKMQDVRSQFKDTDFKEIDEYLESKSVKKEQKGETKENKGNDENNNKDNINEGTVNRNVNQKWNGIKYNGKDGTYILITRNENGERTVSKIDRFDKAELENHKDRISIYKQDSDIGEILKNENIPDSLKSEEVLKKTDPTILKFLCANAKATKDYEGAVNYLQGLATNENNLSLNGDKLEICYDIQDEKENMSFMNKMAKSHKNIAKVFKPTLSQKLKHIFNKFKKAISKDEEDIKLLDDKSANENINTVQKDEKNNISGELTPEEKKEMQEKIAKMQEIREKENSENKVEPKTQEDSKEI